MYQALGSMPSISGAALGGSFSGSKKKRPRVAQPTPQAAPDWRSLTTQQMTKWAEDPYRVTKAPLEESLQETNLAYNTAANRMKRAALASGGTGGVSSAMSGNIEAARGAEMGQSFRDYQQMAQQIGDERMRALMGQQLSYAELDEQRRQFEKNLAEQAKQARKARRSALIGAALGAAGSALTGGFSSGGAFAK